MDGSIASLDPSFQVSTESGFLHYFNLHSRTREVDLGINLDDQDEAIRLADEYKKPLMSPQKVKSGLSQ